MGSADNDIGRLPAPPLRCAGPAGCAVAGCGRERVSAPAQLCRGHLDLRQGTGDQPMAEFIASPRPGRCRRCPSRAGWPPVRASAGNVDGRLLRRPPAAAADRPEITTLVWTKTTGGGPSTPIGCGGQISFRGLPPLVIAEVLAGLQQRCRVSAVKTKEADLRAVCDDLRRQQVTSISDYVVAAARRLRVQGAGQRPGRARPPGAGHPRNRSPARTNGTWCCSATAARWISPASARRWLRETAKRWAADDLPKRRINPGRHHQRRPGGPPPYRLPGPAVTIAAAAARPRRAPCGAGPRRHGGVLAPARLPGTQPGRSPPTPGSGPAARSGTCSPRPG